MERRPGSATVAVTAEEVRAAFRKLQTMQALATDEEKVVRMRHGVAPDRNAPLPKAAGANAELADELLVMEMQLLRSMRARQRPALELVAAPRTSSSPTKDKIVRALRKKR